MLTRSELARLQFKAWSKITFFFWVEPLDFDWVAGPPGACPGRVKHSLDEPDAARCRKPARPCPTLAVCSPRVSQDVHALHAPEELERYKCKHWLIVSSVEQDEARHTDKVRVCAKAARIEGIECDMEAGTHGIYRTDQPRRQGISATLTRPWVFSCFRFYTHASMPLAVAHRVSDNNHILWLVDERLPAR